MRRHRDLPKDIKDTLPLERGERVLAAAPDANQRWSAGTDRALYLPGDDGSSIRIPWQQIEHAEWDQDAEILRVTESAPFGEQLPLRVVRLEEPPTRLLSLIRERVTASVVVSQHVPLRGPVGVRVVARRRPGSDEPLVWSVAFDEGLDPDAPGVLDAAEGALTEVRGQVEP